MHDLVLIKVTYRGINQDGQGENPTEWLVRDHIPAFRQACPGFVSAIIIPDGAFIQVHLLVTADGWAAYSNSDRRQAIADDARDHGYSSGNVVTVSHLISNDDGSPSSGHGHGPESRDSGNFESAVHHFG